MSAPTHYYNDSPDAIKALIALEIAIGKFGLDPMLLDLVKLRASQMNGCAYCVALHTGDLIKSGESERRLAGLPAWQGNPLFTERERAALRLTELLTNVARAFVPDGAYERLDRHFSPLEQVNLTMVINAISCWNRLSVGAGKTFAA